MTRSGRLGKDCNCAGDGALAAAQTTIAQSARISLAVMLSSGAAGRAGLFFLRVSIRTQSQAAPGRALLGKCMIDHPSAVSPQ
jgi:hypothetical protein